MSCGLPPMVFLAPIQKRLEVLAFISHHFSCHRGHVVRGPSSSARSRAASRQQSTEGRVIGYERSNHNQCRYTFSVHGRPYGGMRSALTADVTVGDRVLVYFDSQDPTMNALDDFSAMSQRDKGFVFMLLIVIGGFAGFILYSKTTHARS
jgi:hypothetical protein